MNYEPRSVAGKCVRHYRSVPPVLVLGSGVCVVWLAAAAGVRDGEMGRVETGPGAASPRPRREPRALIAICREDRAGNGHDIDMQYTKKTFSK